MPQSHDYRLSSVVQKCRMVWISYSFFCSSKECDNFGQCRASHWLRSNVSCVGFNAHTVCALTERFGHGSSIIDAVALHNVGWCLQSYRTANRSSLCAHKLNIFSLVNAHLFARSPPKQNREKNQRKKLARNFSNLSTAGDKFLFWHDQMIETHINLTSNHNHVTINLNRITLSAFQRHPNARTI